MIKLIPKTYLFKLSLIENMKFIGMQIFFSFLKVHVFGSTFSLNLSLSLKTVLNSITTLNIL